MTAKRKHKHARPDMERPAETITLHPDMFPDDEYAMRVSGDCLAPEIQHGDAVLIDRRLPYEAGDLVCVFLKPECVGPGDTNCRIKRLVFGMMPGITFPYEPHPDSNVMPVLICEQDNPPLQYTITADKILGIHRCLGLVPDTVTLYEADDIREAAASAGFSRRDLLVGTAAVVPAAWLAAVPAVATEADAELLRLWPQYLEATRAVTAARAAHQPYRDALDASALPIGQKFDTLWDECGAQPSWDAVNAAWDEQQRICEAIRATPAAGVVGIAIKLSARHDDIEDEDETMDAVYSDINRLTGYSFCHEYAEAAGVWEDAS